MQDIFSFICMKRLLPIVLVIPALLLAVRAFAFSTDGTISASNHYAWSAKVGWVDFLPTNGNIHVTDSGLTGSAWSETMGWISLSCSNTDSCDTVNYGVVNDGEGHLFGYAWGAKAGYIDFAPSGGGVSIDASGDFSGSAWSETVGWISFAGDGYKVQTDWRPASASPTLSPASSNSSVLPIGGARGQTGGTNRNGVGIGGAVTVKGEEQHLAPSVSTHVHRRSSSSSSPLSSMQQRVLARKLQRMQRWGMTGQ